MLDDLGGADAMAPRQNNPLINKHILMRMVSRFGFFPR